MTSLNEVVDHPLSQSTNGWGILLCRLAVTRRSSDWEELPGQLLGLTCTTWQ